MGNGQSDNSVKIDGVIIGTRRKIPVELHKLLKTLNQERTLYFKVQKSVLLNLCSILRQTLDNRNQLRIYIDM